jgi:hypothetical protein
MKIKCFSLLLLLAFSGGCGYKKYTASYSKILPRSPFPAPPPRNAPVPLYEWSNLPADTAYQTIYYETGSYTDLSDENVQADLKNIDGPAKGADLLLIDTVLNRQAPAPKGRQQVFFVKYLRYRRNLDYIGDFLKYKKISAKPEDKSDFVPAATVAFDYERKVWKIYPEALPDGEAYYNNYLQRYDWFRLTESKEARFKGKEDKPSLRVYREFNKQVGKVIPVEKIKIKYQNDRIASLMVEYPLKLDEKLNSLREQLIPTYNAQNQIVALEVKSLNGKPKHLKLYFAYDVRGRLQQTILNQLTEERETAFLRADYEYFSPADFSASYP